MFTNRRLHVTLLCALGGALVDATSARAQGVDDPPPPLPVAAWRIGVSGGLMTEPILGGGAGPAVAVEMARRLGRSLSLAFLGVGSRASDEGLSSTGSSYDFDREWFMATVGVEAPLIRAPRFDVGVGVQAGAKWSRISNFAWIGTPPPGQQTPVGDSWDEGAVLIPSVQMGYRVSGPLVISARLGSVTHIFTDDLIGQSGVLLTVGAALAW